MLERRNKNRFNLLLKRREKGVDYKALESVLNNSEVTDFADAMRIIGLDNKKDMELQK